MYSSQQKKDTYEKMKKMMHAIVTLLAVYASFIMHDGVDIPQIILALLIPKLYIIYGVYTIGGFKPFMDAILGKSS